MDDKQKKTLDMFTGPKGLLVAGLVGGLASLYLAIPLYRRGDCSFLTSAGIVIFMALFMPLGLLLGRVLTLLTDKLSNRGKKSVQSTGEYPS